MRRSRRCACAVSRMAQSSFRSTAEPAQRFSRSIKAVSDGAVAVARLMAKLHNHQSKEKYAQIDRLQSGVPRWLLFRRRRRHELGPQAGCGVECICCRECQVWRRAIVRQDYRRAYEELLADPGCAKAAPVVAEQMNNLPKIVFSKKLDKASWNNTKLVAGDLAAEIRKMKNKPGEQMVIMGSGTIVSQLTAEGLIDEYQIVVNPIVLGKRRTMFEGIKRKLNLKRTKTRSFGNGNVLLCYEPIT